MPLWWRILRFRQCEFVLALPLFMVQSILNNKIKIVCHVMALIIMIVKAATLIILGILPI